MKVRTIALAAPLVLGAACMHSSTRSSAGTASAGQAAPQQPQASAGTTGEVTQDPLFQSGPSEQGHAGDAVVAGRIAEVTNDTLSVRTSQGETHTLQIVPETEVQLDGRDASPDDLAEGAPVRASFDVVDGEQVAVKVHAGASEPGPGASSLDQGPAAPEQGSSGSGSSGTGTPGVGEPSGGAGSSPSGGSQW